MSRIETVSDILSSIYFVRGRAKELLENKHLDDYMRVMGDLWTLEVLLVSETQKLVDELRSNEND